MENAPSILVFKNCILNRKIESNEKCELWEGRHRSIDEIIRAYIYFNPLEKSIIKEIDKWMLLGTYSISSDKIIRYLDFFTTTSPIINKNKPITVLIIQSINNYVTLESFLKTNLQIEDQIRYFNQLIRIFYSLHGSGITNLKFNGRNILWSNRSKNLKVFKDPAQLDLLPAEPGLQSAEILNDRKSSKRDPTALLKEEFLCCEKILKSLFTHNLKINFDKLKKKEIKLQYITKIIELYGNTEILPSPKDIFIVLDSFFDKIRKAYNSYNDIDNDRTRILQGVQLVGLLAIFKNINIPLPQEINSKNLMAILHNILPRISQQNLETLSLHNLKIVSALEGNSITSNLTVISMDNILSYHGIVKDAYQYDNANKIIQLIVDSPSSAFDVRILRGLNQSEFNVREKLGASGRIGSPLDLGILEDCRIWYRDQYFFNRKVNDKNNLLKIHNTLIKVIIEVDKWFYDNFNIDYTKLILRE